MMPTHSVDPSTAIDMQPVYNIKAVVEATGLSAATLRAWERRYGALSPTRNGKGYRLYSAHEISMLRWLKARLDEGLSISQAIVLMDRQCPAVLPRDPTPSLAFPRDLSAVRQALLAALVDFNEGGAEHIIAEAYALYFAERLPDNGVPARFTVHVVDVPDRAASYEFYGTALYQRALQRTRTD